LREKILAAGDLPASPEFSMVTDARGRFRLERLPDGEPLSHKVHAVARGYAPGGVEVGLSREVVIELTRARPGEGASEDAGGESEVAAPSAKERLEVLIAGPDGPLRGASVMLVSEDGLRRIEARTDAEGRLAKDVPPGAYAVFVVEDDSFRSTGSVVRSGAGEAAVAYESRGVDVRLTLRRDGRLLGTSAYAGLVRIDAAMPDLIALPCKEAGVFTGRAPAGQYALFLNDTFAADVRLPEDAHAALDLRSLAVDLRLRVPDELGDEEVVRVRAAIVPAFIAASPILRRMYGEETSRGFTAARSGPPHRISLVAPGAYVLAGQSDLGPLEAPFTVRGSGDIEVDITPR